jgi:hypothetical protein
MISSTKDESPAVEEKDESAASREGILIPLRRACIVCPEGTGDRKLEGRDWKRNPVEAILGLLDEGMFPAPADFMLLGNKLERLADLIDTGKLTSPYRYRIPFEVRNLRGERFQMSLVIDIPRDISCSILAP